MSRIVEEKIAILIWISLFTLLLLFLVKCRDETTMIIEEIPPLFLHKILQQVLFEIPDNSRLYFKLPNLGRNYTIILNSYLLESYKAYIIEKREGEVRIYPCEG